MKREKDKEIYILCNIYRIHALAGRIVDREGKPAALPFDGFEKTDPVLCSPHLFGELAGWDAGYAEGEYRVWDDGGYWYYVFHSAGYYVIWGPVVFEEHSAYKRRLYAKRHGVQGDMCAVPLADIGKLEDTVLFAHGLLSGQYGKNVAIAHGKAAERIREELLPQLFEYGIENAEYRRDHHSFAREQQMWKWMIEGGMNAENLNSFLAETGQLFMDVAGGVGIMSESPRKNQEYAAVSGITLITRYAIAAGLDEQTAYGLSDVALQRISKAADVMEIGSIMNYAFQEFARLSREAAAKAGSRSLYVERGREYIAKHIYGKLLLPEIAGAAGLHPGYFSRIFAGQMGMTVMEYVMQEKVRVSCNLLKYSNQPIAVIAEYMNLSPQSYFTRIFKKVMGETPARYRKTHADKNFLES